MKHFFMTAVIAGVAALPLSAHAQWVKDSGVEIVDFNVSGVEVRGSTYSPQSSGGDGSTVKAESTRADDDREAYVYGLSYTARQKYKWAFTIQGPPTPNFNIDIAVGVSGEANPPYLEGPDSYQSIGSAASTATAGGLSGDALNNGTSAQASFTNSRTSRVTVGFITQPAPDIYHARYDISMIAASTAMFYMSYESQSSDGKGGLPAEPPTVEYMGKANHAKAQGEVDFSAPVNDGS